MSPTPPANSPQERTAALQAALAAREQRAAIKAAIAAGTQDVGSVLDAGHRGQGDPIHGRLQVGDVVLAINGIGPVKGAEVLAEAGITNAEEHLDELSAEQVSALKTELGLEE